MAPKAELAPELNPAAAAKLSRWLQDYQRLPGVPDELFDAAGRPNTSWLKLLSHFAEYPEAEFQNRFSLATRHIRETGVSYRIFGEENERAWPLNPMPLILTEGEWGEISKGVEQRFHLMEAILGGVYGSRDSGSVGAMPAAALAGSSDYLRSMKGVAPPGGRYLSHYAVDLGRGPDGRWWVLGDRTQSPSGAGYALENRLVTSRAFANLYSTMNVHRLAGFFDGFRRGLSAASVRSDPRICLLSAGPYSETYYEQAHIARYLGLLLVEGEDLVVRDDKVYIRTIEGLKRVDVILRRVDADFIDPLELNNASRLGTPGLMAAIRSGGVAVMNAPGTGVLESRSLLGFMPSLCRTLLGEDLLIPNVATWWCGQPPERIEVEERLNELALAPAFDLAGADWDLKEATLLGDMSPVLRDQVLGRLRDRPFDLVAQEVVQLSTMPTLRGGVLEAAPFVLRVYATATPEGVSIMPGGFCRTSLNRDARAISMGDDAETSDVWVVADHPVERISLLSAQENAPIRRLTGRLPSRAADNLFWLGRYLERAEGTVRLVRSLCASVLEAEQSLHSDGVILSRLERLLIEWGALDKSVGGVSAIAAARDALYDPKAYGSVTSLVRSATRTASSMRERLSPDFWTLLVRLEERLSAGPAAISSETDVLTQTESALQVLAALSGLAQENMNRVAGWRFLDLGRRIERGVNTCQFVRELSGKDATVEEIDLLLDLTDSQITYRARYLAGLSSGPVLDLVVLDPFNTRSIGFQIFAAREHLAALPSLREDGMLEAPRRLSLDLASQIEIRTADELGEAELQRLESGLMNLSKAIGDRYFLQGANAVPTVKLAGLG